MYIGKGLTTYHVWDDGWDKTKMKPSTTCIHVWHYCIFVNGYKLFIMHAIICLIQGFFHKMVINFPTELWIHL